MKLADMVLHLIELALLLICLFVTGVQSMKFKNIENELRAENEGLKFEIKESEERCRRLSYTCIDVVNRKILEGGNYAD